MASNETLYIPDNTILTTAAGGERATLLWTYESPRRPGSNGTCGEHEWQDCSMYMHGAVPLQCPALISGNGTFGLSRVHARAPATVYLVEIAAPSHGAVITDNRLEVVGVEECGSGKYINVANVLHIGQATGFSVARNGVFSQTYGSLLAVILHINAVPCCWESEIHHANEGRYCLSVSLSLCLSVSLSLSLC